jgi:accessory gene regulator protein AgrB
MFGEIFALVEPGEGINGSIWYQFISYLLGVMYSYGMYASYILSAVGIAFQYFHIREKKEGISVDASIQNFERL